MSHRRPPIPIHAAEGPTRREAMAWMAASLALAGGGCTRPPDRPIYSYAQMPEIEANGQAIHYASAFVRDGFAHGVLVGTQQGRPVKVDGNPSHPASLGGTDVFAQAAVLQLWDPDRSQVVMRRDGVVSTWNAFAAAWREREARWAAHGAALRVLTGRFTSPTQHAQLAALLGRHPGARWHRHDAVDAGGAQAGAELAFGRRLQPLWHFERADLVVTLACDPFSHGPAAVRHAADWARRRAEALKAGTPLPRAIALECAPGLFGARADERVALPPVEIERLAWRLAARWLPGMAAPGGASTGLEQRLAARIAQHDGRVLLCAGESLLAETHALVHALNQRFHAFGRTLDAIAPPEDDAASGRPGTLAGLVAAMEGGEVDTLLVLGGNPAYNAPSVSRFAAALGRVPFSAHLSLYRDETSRLAAWHLPLSHDFEQWGDARAFDGTLTPLQPAIAPLYDTRSVHELLAMLTGEASIDAHALLRRRARREGEDDAAFESRWRRELQQGRVEATAFAPEAVPDARLPTMPSFANDAEALWGVFAPDASIGDGHFANNGWLQELPRPFIKLTWGNALQLGPETAKRLGVATGDVVRVIGPGAAIEAPVWLQAGHAENAATLPHGYGRRAAGRVGDGVGFDVAPLRGAVPGPVALRIERTGRRHDFAVTQVEMQQHGRELARRVGPHESLQQANQALPTLYPPRADEPARAFDGPAWGMAIDLDACIGCNVCTVACQAENNIPVVGAEEVSRGRVMHWIRVDQYPELDGRADSQPVPCMHCENAPCEVVCPVGATQHDSEGLNMQVYNRCIGTRFCSNNCPYKVRRFNFLQYADTTTEPMKALRNPEVTVRSRGVMEKCSYCVQRLSHARRDAQKRGVPVKSDEVVTACQAACPTEAIHFGDINDPQSDVAKAKASPRHYALLGELNTKPRTTYLARVESEADGSGPSPPPSPASGRGGREGPA
jgi:molybdopterin-containing oxidoreductase family iron-sulfur binding subunit